MDSVFSWISDRVREPSSWAAVSAGLIGLGVVLDNPVLVIIGLASVVVAITTKEKGNW
tara:strand:+ start:1507 stop:1680 length:174 start_codon:yes stop_codon:yes gene_type:complete